MPLTQTAFEKLVRNIQLQKTESSYVDCKEDLSLESDGDKASFIRDAAALANNVIESYLIIGIQDKTWAEIGLVAASSLLDPDQTQSRMNQILENKLDPQISIRYQVIELNRKSYGVVIISGNHAPYIIAINDVQYGGNKTKGTKSYINRGVIYVRHGDTTIIANRQSRILEILNPKNSTNSPGEKSAQLQEFLTKNAYHDVEALEFGKNLLTQGLVEKIWSQEEQKNIIVPAKSWVSILIYPLNEPCKLIPNAVLEKLRPGERIGRDGSWFHGLSRPIEDMLRAEVTPKGILGMWSGNRDLNPDEYMQAINILPTGIVHFAGSYPLFYQNKNVRFYAFVSVIGYLWQLIYLTKAIYEHEECKSDVAIMLNFSGAKGTVLADLAKGSKKIWIDVFDWRYNDDPRNINQEASFQIYRELSDYSDDKIESLIHDIAGEIGHYYNQLTPRCFTPDTDEFPVRQYQQNNNW